MNPSRAKSDAREAFPSFRDWFVYKYGEQRYELLKSTMDLGPVEQSKQMKVVYETIRLWRLWFKEDEK